MAGAYPDDPRAKFLASSEADNVGLEKLASTFQVSRAWAEKVWRTKRETGSANRPLWRVRGFPSRLTPEIRQRLAIQIDKQTDAAVNELREWMQQQERIAIGQQRLPAIINEPFQMDKDHSGPAPDTPQPSGHPQSLNRPLATGMAHLFKGQHHRWSGVAILIERFGYELSYMI